MDRLTQQSQLTVTNQSANGNSGCAASSLRAAKFCCRFQGCVDRLATAFIWLLSLIVWANPTIAQTTTWKGAFDNIKGMGESGSEVLNMIAVLIGSGMAIFGWVGLTSETKKQQRGVMGSIILIVVGALLIVWRVVVKTNVGQIFGEGTDVPFLDN